MSLFHHAVCLRIILSISGWMAVLACGAAVDAQAVPQARCGEFTIAVIPDTQNYVDYNHQEAAAYPIDAENLLLEQMQYIASHAKGAGGDIVFATAEGDVWQHSPLPIDPDHAARGYKVAPLWHPHYAYNFEYRELEKVRQIEIPNAVKGYRIIEGRLPFSVVPGNHDYDAEFPDARFPVNPEAKDFTSRYGRLVMGGLTDFQSAFSDKSSFFQGKSWYVASHDGGADSAQIFSAGSCKFLHMGLQWESPNETLAWAESVLKQYPGIPTIITTHKFLAPDGERSGDGAGDDGHAVDPNLNNPQMIWEKFIRRHDQIFMVLCGHLWPSRRRMDENQFGHEVYQIMADYQARWHVGKDAGLKDPGFGLGDGWMRLMTFRLDSEQPTVRVRTYSTHYQQFSSDLKDYASWYKAEERPSLSDADFLSEDDFVIALKDFHSRFPDGGWNER